jgi:hypothetical protein
VVVRTRGDFFAVDQSVKRDWNFFVTCCEDTSRGISSIFSFGTASGVGCGLGLGDSVFKTLRINSLGLSLLSSARSDGLRGGDLSALDGDELGVSAGNLNRTEEADLETEKLGDSATGLVDRAELRGPMTGLDWVELDGVLVVTLLDLVGLTGTLVAEGFAVDITLLPEGGTIPPPVRLTPPYLGSRDRVFSVGFPILDIPDEPILDIDAPGTLALPTTWLALEVAVTEAGLVRDVAPPATGGFFRMLVGNFDDLDPCGAAGTFFPPI